MTFKNRIWSAPAGTHLLAGLEEYPNEAVIAYYANKAKGGSANITFSAQNMDIYRPNDDVHAHENIFPQKNHRMWRQLTDAVHYYGAKISLELLAFEYHGYDDDGNLVSYTVNGHGKRYPKLTKPVMERIAASYADAAEAALDCGFDMLLITAAMDWCCPRCFPPSSTPGRTNSAAVWKSGEVPDYDSGCHPGIGWDGSC